MISSRDVSENDDICEQETGGWMENDDVLTNCVGLALIAVTAVMGRLQQQLSQHYYQ